MIILCFLRDKLLVISLVKNKTKKQENINTCFSKCLLRNNTNTILAILIILHLYQVGSETINLCEPQEKILKKYYSTP